MKSKSAYRLMSIVFVLLLILIASSALIINYFMYNPAEADTVLNLGVGEIYEYPNDGYKIRFYSYNKDIVTVDKNGIITANSKGTAQIAAGRKRIDINVFDAPESVDVKEKSFSIGVGEEYTLAPFIPDSELNTGFEYSVSGDKEALTIDKKGKIKAVKSGKATVTISTYNKKTVSCEIRVGNPPEKISLSANTKTLYLGATGKVYINIPADCASKETTIESSNEKVIKVNSKCELTPVAVGAATIKATTYNGKSATCNITVAEKPYYIRTDLDPKKPMVAFTFDDGQNSPTTNRILKVFEKYKSSCTFFIVGERTKSKENAECIKRMVKNGFQLGNHTYDHEHYGSEVTIQDITRCADRLNDLCGFGPTAFRPTGGFMSDIIKKNCGAPIILWNIDTEDWKLRDGDKVYHRILNEVKDGGIVLMHDIYPSTAYAIEHVVPKLIENGYQIVNVAELAYYKGKTLENGKVYYSIK